MEEHNIPSETVLINGYRVPPNFQFSHTLLKRMEVGLHTKAQPLAPVIAPGPVGVSGMGRMLDLWLI